MSPAERHPEPMFSLLHAGCGPHFHLEPLAVLVVAALAWAFVLVYEVRS